LQRLDLGCTVGAEADVVKAAEGGGIFVLLAHVPFQAEASDAESSLIHRNNQHIRLHLATMSARSLSFWTSPTISISGWSAIVAITSSRIRRG